VVVLGRRRRESGADVNSSGIDVPDKIDFAAAGLDQSTVDLHIAQRAPWGRTDRTAQLLDDKVDTYVSFAVSGRLAAAYPQFAHLPWRIVVDCSWEPDRRVVDTLSQIERRVLDAGGGLVVRHPHELVERRVRPTDVLERALAMFGARASIATLGGFVAVFVGIATVQVRTILIAAGVLAGVAAFHVPLAWASLVRERTPGRRLGWVDLVMVAPLAAISLAVLAAAIFT
jgi:hypothetical protein